MNSKNLLPKITFYLKFMKGCLKYLEDQLTRSNCGAATEEVSKFLGHHLKPIMQQGKSYIRDSEEFLSKIRNFTFIPDVVGLYPIIPHSGGLSALTSTLENWMGMQIPTSDLVKMAEFALLIFILNFLIKFTKRLWRLLFCYWY